MFVVRHKKTHNYLFAVCQRKNARQTIFYRAFFCRAPEKMRTAKLRFPVVNTFLHPHCCISFRNDPVRSPRLASPRHLRHISVHTLLPALPCALHRASTQPNRCVLIHRLCMHMPHHSHPYRRHNLLVSATIPPLHNMVTSLLS
jgi:hypothetical protein